jgi:hypothetical protein
MRKNILTRELGLDISIEDFDFVFSMFGSGRQNISEEEFSERISEIESV